MSSGPGATESQGRWRQATRKGEKAHPVEDLNENEGLTLPHTQESVIPVSEDVAKVLDVLIRVRIELREFFKHNHVWNGPLQQINKRGNWRPIFRLKSQRQLSRCPEFIRKPKPCGISGTRWPFAIHGHLHYRHLGTVGVRHSSREHLNRQIRNDIATDKRGVLTSNVTIPNAKTSDWGVELPSVPSFCSIAKSSGAIHLTEPLNPLAEVSVQLRLAMVLNPKSRSRARPD